METFTETVEEIKTSKYFMIGIENKILEYATIQDMIAKLKSVEDQRKLDQSQQQNIWFDIHNATEYDFKMIQKVFRVQPITIEVFLEKFSSNESFYEFVNYISISLVIERTEDTEKILHIIFSKYFILTLHGIFYKFNF